jgi:Arc/MetJ family transcription regulator
VAEAIRAYRTDDRHAVIDLALRATTRGRDPS